MSDQPTHWSQTNSINHAVWHLVEKTDALTEAICAQNHVSPELAQCLAWLDLKPGEQVQRFLMPSWEDLHDAREMLGMDKAVERLKAAVAKQESIRVVTDYDVDGTMSSLILQSTLAIMGNKKVTYHIPDRKQEGYGFTEFAAKKAIEDEIQIIVTADIGVRDQKSIHLAKAHGIDVIVLDHHLPPNCDVPEDAYVVLCPPQKSCHYPNEALAACGISLKFAQAALHDHPAYALIMSRLIKLAALGTVADVVSLIKQENRAIVSLGLQALNSGDNRGGLKALLEVAKCPPGSINSEKIGFAIAPRINAAGRLASAMKIIDLMHATNEFVASQLAHEIDLLNKRRQDVQEEMIEIAIAEASNSEDAFIFIVHEECETWHSGVSGIVAGRVREALQRPTAIATQTGKSITGSIRSTPNVHAVAALDHVSPWLKRYGGHAAAAGFTFDADDLENVKAGLSENVILQLGKPYETPTFDIHFILNLENITDALVDDFQKLEPCGKDNKPPVICLQNVMLRKTAWLKEKHFKASISSNVEVFWPSAPTSICELLERPVDLIGTIKRNDSYRSVITFMPIDARPSQS